MTDPGTISPDEGLGRGVFSSKHRKRARRSRVPHHVFLERQGETTISVDRIDQASPEEAAAIGTGVASLRQRTFYGWAVVEARDASSNRRRVEATPLPDNPYHADIILLDITSKILDEQEIWDEQMRHAQELADVSYWRDPPNPP